MPIFKFVWPALRDFSQTNPKNTLNIWLFWQWNTFGTKFGYFCTIQKRFEHIWIKNGHAVRFYFWTLFANLDFLNFIACAIVHCCQFERQQQNLITWSDRMNTNALKNSALPKVDHGTMFTMICPKECQTWTFVIYLQMLCHQIVLIGCPVSTL